MRFIIILTIVLQLAPLCAAHAQSGSPPVITGQVGDSGKSGLHWKSVECAAGSAINTIAINEGGWTAGIEFFCSQPTATNDWPLATPMISPFVGGENGDHQSQLTCPRNTWVVGLTGTEIDVHYLANTQFRHFLANPIAMCSRPATSAPTTAVPDPKYKPVKTHEDGMSGPYNLGASTTMCPSDMYATGMDIAVEPDHHPDIKAIKLHCKTRADL